MRACAGLEHHVPELADLHPAPGSLPAVDVAQLAPRQPGGVPAAGAVRHLPSAGAVRLQHGPGEGAACQCRSHHPCRDWPHALRHRPQGPGCPGRRLPGTVLKTVLIHFECM